MMNENTLQETIEYTNTEVISRIHQIKGRDIFAFFIEHRKTLIFSREDHKFDGIEQIKL